VNYHYFKVVDLFPEASETSAKDMIRDGAFCNQQCGRMKLSTTVTEAMTNQKLLDLLSVFKDPSTKNWASEKYNP